MKPTPNPTTKSKSKSNAKRRSIEFIPSRSTTNSNAESSTISNLSPQIQASYTDNLESISSQMHAKTMELLSYDEDDKSIELDNDNDDDQIALSSFEVNDSNLRIRKLSNTKNSFELEQLLHEQYSQDDEGMEEDDDESDSHSGTESELSPQETLEIERRKSDQIIKEQSLQKKSLTQQPNLLRSDTTSEWQKDDIEKLQNDMKKELLSLQAINSNKDKSQKHKKRNFNKNYKIVLSGHVSSATEDDNDNDNENAPYSNLFREKSRDKWETEEVNQTRKDMERAMFDLMKASKKNKDKDNDKLSSCDSSAS